MLNVFSVFSRLKTPESAICTAEFISTKSGNSTKKRNQHKKASFYVNSRRILYWQAESAREAESAQEADGTSRIPHLGGFATMHRYMCIDM